MELTCSVCRLKTPVQKKKYGLLSNYDDSVEMEAAESEEDDTLYEARSLRRSEVNDTEPLINSAMIH